MRRIPRFRERSPHTLKRRLGALFRRLVQRRFVSSPRVVLLRLGRTRYKRVTFGDAFRAGQVARTLDEYREERIFPRLVAHLENELLVEYVPGETGRVFDDAAFSRLAEFFAALYGRSAGRAPVDAARFAAAAELDLGFLRDAGVLDDAAHRELCARLPDLAPKQVRVGTEYADALPKNFVRVGEGRLVAIDVDAIERDALLGVGVCKTLLDVDADRRERLLTGLRERGGPDLAPTLPFVELCFLASWTKRLFLKGRHRLVDPARFDALRAGAPRR